MAKGNWTEIDRKNAWLRGQDDYPVKGRGPYNFAKQPEAHTAYWEGWNAEGLEVDRKEEPHGGARSR